MKHYRIEWNCGNSAAVIQANREPTIEEIRERLSLSGEIHVRECSPPQVWYLDTGWKGTAASKSRGAPTHVCGLQGYDPNRDPPCPGCVPWVKER